MTPKDIANNFYTAFSQGDAGQMVNCYHEDVVFSDPAFGTLHGHRAQAMWQMLLSNKASALTVTYNLSEHTDHTAQVHWQANYLFGPSKRKVVNHVQASLVMKDGKIIRHADTFDFWKWSRQALGMPGLLLGWSPVIKSSVRKRTNALLDRYMASNP
ncbi:nuclear transport factor 2 family protein [Roseivirga sp. BDSF3-8]|uniref:nuclear transport factor 2 family protein n=1 Tax=Roseivirga sp. BDSF3-8 TaxID=3241598 RepID=UPI0035325EC0